MCIFCSICNGDIPSTKLYESEHCIVIFDINPINEGHTLVVTKEHFSELSSAPDEILLDMMRVVKKMYPILSEVYKADGITTFENYGLHQEIDHIHFHLLPVFKERVGIEFKHCSSLDASLEMLETIKSKIGDLNE